MVFSKVGPNQSIEWGQIRVSKSAIDGAIQTQDPTMIRKVLERCILAGQDLRLPPMSDTETARAFFIIACTGASGAAAMTRRLRGELDSPRHKLAISATTLQLSANGQRWEERITEIATRIDKLIQTHLLERSISLEC